MENALDNMKILIKLNTRLLSKEMIPYIVRNRETREHEQREEKGRKGKALQCLTQAAIIFTPTYF